MIPDLKVHRQMDGFFELAIVWLDAQVLQLDQILGFRSRRHVASACALPMFFLGNTVHSRQIPVVVTPAKTISLNDHPWL